MYFNFNTRWVLGHIEIVEIKLEWGERGREWRGGGGRTGGKRGGGANQSHQPFLRGDPSHPSRYFPACCWRASCCEASGVFGAFVNVSCDAHREADTVAGRQQSKADSGMSWGCCRGLGASVSLESSPIGRWKNPVQLRVSFISGNTYGVPVSLTGDVRCDGLWLTASGKKLCLQRLIDQNGCTVEKLEGCKSQGLLPYLRLLWALQNRHSLPTSMSEQASCDYYIENLCNPWT